MRSNTKAVARAETLQQPSRFTKWKKTLVLLTMVAPTAIWLLLLRYLPMGGIVLAFKNYKINPRNPSFWSNLVSSQWVGFKNFEFLFKTDAAWVAIRNTLLYNVVFIILGAIIPVAFAIMMNEITKKFVAKAYQTMMFFPYFLSWVVVSYFVYAFLNPDKGLMNTIIQALGGDKIMWYSQPKWWPLILTFMQVWKSMGYNMVVYLASITGIDSTLYEAATLDGATKWQQTKYITLPALKPIIVMMFILNVGHIFYSDFGLFYQVTQGVPNSLYNVASTFDTYVYQALQSNVTIGRTAAAGLFQAACCCATVLVANFIVSKIDEESAII